MSNEFVMGSALGKLFLLGVWHCGKEADRLQDKTNSEPSGWQILFSMSCLSSLYMHPIA